MNVYDDLKYYHWPSGRPKAVIVKAMDVMNNSSFASGLRKIIRYVAYLYNGLPGGKELRVFRTDATGIVREEVDSILSLRRSVRMLYDQPVLDSADILRAEDDLKHVTELVGIEGADPVIIQQEDATEPVSDDPWADLVSRLSKGQREYLSKALAGMLRAMKPMVEGSINEVAMDTVKDAVIEDGEVFDEYAEDLKNAMRMQSDEGWRRGRDSNSRGLPQRFSRPPPYRAWLPRPDAVHSIAV